jgi:transcriptional regulator with XRE-family HTH domain
MDYNKRIRELRLKARLTQGQLAEAMGLETPNFLSQIETGRKKVGLSVIVKFCAALDMEMADFFKEPRDRYPDKMIPLVDLSSTTAKDILNIASRKEAEGFFLIEKPVDLKDQRAYCAIVSGDEMTPALKDRDAVFLAPSQPYREGDKVLVGLSAGEVLVREVCAGDNNLLLLESCNPSVEARGVEVSEVQFVHPILWVRYNMPNMPLPGLPSF